MRYEAVYKSEHGGFIRKPVARFLRGVAMVTDNDAFPTATLRSADTFRNFVRIQERDARTVAAIPGNGWLAEYEIDGTKEVVRSLILYWAIDENGDATPMVLDHECGTAYIANSCSNFVGVIHESKIQEVANANGSN